MWSLAGLGHGQIRIGGLMEKVNKWEVTCKYLLRHGCKILGTDIIVIRRSQEILTVMMPIILLGCSRQSPTY